MSNDRLRQAGVAFQEAGLAILEAIEDKRLRKQFALRMRCLQAAVGEFVDHVQQAQEALQDVSVTDSPEF